MTDHFTDPLAVRLQNSALALPEAMESGACVKRAFKVKRKGFLCLPCGPRPPSAAAERE